MLTSVERTESRPKKTYNTIYYLVCLGATLRCGDCGGLVYVTGFSKGRLLIQN